MSRPEFEKKLLDSKLEFKDEMVRRMALLKVRDTDIFKQVKSEIEVDME